MAELRRHMQNQAVLVRGCLLLRAQCGVLGPADMVARISQNREGLFLVRNGISGLHALYPGHWL